MQLDNLIFVDFFHVVETTCIKLVNRNSSSVTSIKAVDNLQETCYHQAWLELEYFCLSTITEQRFNKASENYPQKTYRQIRCSSLQLLRFFNHASSTGSFRRNVFFLFTLLWFFVFLCIPLQLFLRLAFCTFLSTPSQSFLKLQGNDERQFQLRSKSTHWSGNAESKDKCYAYRS